MQPKMRFLAKQKFGKTSQFWTLHNEPEKHAKTRKYIEILTAGKYFAGKIFRAQSKLLDFQRAKPKERENAQRER